MQQLDAYLMERYNNHCSSDPDNEVAIRFTLIEGTTGEFVSHYDKQFLIYVLYFFGHLTSANGGKN